MRYMPLFVDLKNRKVLIIGGGRVALRRARQFSEAGAHLTIIAPEILPEFAGLPNSTQLLRKACAEDISSNFLLTLIASNDSQFNAEMAERCRSLNLLFNRCDSFEESSFINGSLINAGEIIGAVTSGGVPAISKHLQKKIEQLLTPELLELSRLLAELRPAIKASKLLQGSHNEFIASWVNEETLARLRDENSDNLRQEILACL